MRGGEIALDYTPREKDGGRALSPTKAVLAFKDAAALMPECSTSSRWSTSIRSFPAMHEHAARYAPRGGHSRDGSERSRNARAADRVRVSRAFSARPSARAGCARRSRARAAPILGGAGSFAALFLLAALALIRSPISYFRS